jgi:hypothetical protein
MDGMSRRGILGALGASALAAIPFPFKPKPTDIVIASEVPEAGAVTQAIMYNPVVESLRLYEPYDGPRPFDMVGKMLFDKSGREVVLVTDVTIESQAYGPPHGWMRGEFTSPIRHYMRR